MVLKTQGYETSSGYFHLKIVFFIVDKSLQFCGLENDKANKNLLIITNNECQMMLVSKSYFTLSDKNDIIIAVRYIEKSGEWSLFVNNELEDKKVFPKTLQPRN